MNPFFTALMQHMQGANPSPDGAAPQAVAQRPGQQLFQDMANRMRQSPLIATIMQQRQGGAGQQHPMANAMQQLQSNIMSPQMTQPNVAAPQIPPGQAFFQSMADRMKQNFAQRRAK